MFCFFGNIVHCIVAFLSHYCDYWVCFFLQRLSQQLARGEEALSDKEEEEDGTISPLEVARR